MSEVMMDSGRRRPRRWVGRVAMALAAAALLVAVVLALALQRAPSVTRVADSSAARDALAAGEVLRGFLAAGGAADSLTLGEPEIDAVMAAASRLAPGVAAAARPIPEGIELDASFGAPRVPLGLWVNVALRLAAGPEGLRIEAARIGRLPLPPAVVEEAAILVADRLIGAPLARQAMAGVTRFDLVDGRFTVHFGYDADERRALIDRLRGALGTGGRDKAPLSALIWHLHNGGETGALPASGSALPYIRYAIERADRISRRFPQATDRELAEDALIALAMYCGEPAIGSAVGAQLQPKMRDDGNHCARTRFGGRDDLRKHFTVSAALYALSSGDAAFGVGELKELSDSGPGGSGFSFDDMAANLAGARFAAAFLETPRSQWPALLELVRTEADILPDLSGLPSGMTPEEFAARFGEIDSPAYRAMVAEIRARVAALPLEAAR